MTAFAATHHFVAYWSKNGQRATLGLKSYAALDPERTIGPFISDPIAPCSRMPEESQVESSEHQNNANIHCQPFPELVSEEHEIYTDYDGCHRHHVKHYSYVSAHFSQHSPDDPMLERIIAFF
jgi:hypothetical protein